MITSMEELCRFINELKCQGSYYFRGYQKEDELKPSIGRRPYNGIEGLQQFGISLLDNKFTQLTFLDLVKLAQHYGIPTNLVDLTSDPWVAIFFGYGVNKSIQFNLLYTPKAEFEQIHENALRIYPIKLTDLFPMKYKDLEKLLLTQLMEISENTIMTKDLFNSPVFHDLYQNFFTVQEKFTFEPYKESGIDNPRMLKQQGMFILTQETDKPIPIEWFQRIEVSFSGIEGDKLHDYLINNNYTKESLLPNEINGVDISLIAKNINSSILPT